MGRDEVVIYFDLCREVIHAGWRLLSQQPLSRGQLSAALYQHSQRWLESGSIDGEPTPPAAIIESSQRHMPRLSDGSHLDCDCPLCRMMMDNPEQFYPTFSGFDGHHLELDDEFAFSLYESREEWEAEQESFRELSERLDRKEEERAREKVAAGDEDDLASVWKSTYVSPEAQAVGVSPLMLGFPTAELVSDLQDRQAPQQQVDDLNAAFDAVRRAPDDPVLKKAATDAMKEQLERLAGDYPDLTNKSADLESQLDAWSRQHVDDDLPF